MIFRVCTCLIVALQTLFLSTGEGASNPYQDLYTNAYIALLEDDSEKVLKLWYIHNTIQENFPNEPRIEGLKSAAWLALDRLNICPENMPHDSLGRGIWPVVLHNFMVRNANRRQRDRKLPDRSLDTFSRGYQRRAIHLTSILAPEEIESLRIHRGTCQAVDKIFSQYPGIFHVAGVGNNYEVLALTLRDLLSRASREENIDPNLSNYLSYRILLINAYLGERSRPKEGDELPVFSKDDDPFGPKTDPKILKAWYSKFIELIELPSEQWYELPAQDRLGIASIYHQVEDDKAIREETFDRWIDYELSDGAAKQLYSMIGFRSAGKRDRELIDSKLGDRLLALGRDDQLPDVGAFSGPRGIQAYRQGKTREALEMFALALSAGEQSDSAQEYRSLSLAWIKYILLEKRFDRRLLEFVKSYLPRSAFKQLIESLIWSAAFHQERFIFQTKNFDNLRLGSKSKALIKRLRNLAQGKHREFLSENQRLLKARRRSSLRFMSQLVAELKSEPLPVVRGMVPVLKEMRRQLEDLKRIRGSGAKQIEAAKASLDSLLAPFARETGPASDRRVANGEKVFLGALRLEPSHDWPWPFRVPKIQAIDIFRPVDLKVMIKDQAFALTVKHEEQR